MTKRTLVSFFLILLIFLGLSRVMGISEGFFEYVTSYMAAPFLRLQAAMVHATSSWRYKQRAVQDLIKDLERSLARADDLQKELIELKSFQSYKEHTNELRDFMAQYSDESARIARILLKNFEGTHFFIVDAGSERSIEKDMIAVYKNAVVGRVIEVYPSYAKILLLTDPQCKIAAFCASTDHKGIHEGVRKLEVTKLNHVDPQATLLVGDMVLSSGEGGIFPRGFGLGRITQWESDGSVSTVFVAPFVDLKRIEHCTLIKNTVELKEVREGAKEQKDILE